VEYPLRWILLSRRSAYARAAALLAAAVSYGVHIGYYRLWRGKVARSLGLQLRPLWRVWTRTRL
jgi:hypothetical protein